MSVCRCEHVCAGDSVWFSSDCLTAGVYGYECVHKTVAALCYVYGAEYCANIYGIWHF